MTLGRVTAALSAVLFALAGAGGRLPASATAQLNHAAVVVDTSDGKVRKFCLAFPEESISGAEALRRIDASAVFGSYGGQGQAVCALCGVGCPSGDCFCDASKYWAYHRAGPGGAPFAYSRAGASSTTVRDGDVEGWRWGAGDPPPPATVGEVCSVPEPPVRTSSGASAATTPATIASPPDPDPDAALVAGPDPVAGAGAGPSPASPTAPQPTPTQSAASAAPAPTTTLTTAAGDDASAAPGVAEGTGADDRGAQPADADADAVADTATGAPGDGSGGGFPSAVGMAGFGVALVGVLGWRARLRRANVRRATRVR